jgi:hypothetical protein
MTVRWQSVGGSRIFCLPHSKSPSKLKILFEKEDSPQILIYKKRKLNKNNNNNASISLLHVKGNA